jgi:uncharacterized protein (DUF488 family)
MIVGTIGHGARPSDELRSTLRSAGVGTLVDVLRFPGSCRNRQFDQASLGATVEDAGIVYCHAAALGARLADEPGEDRFGWLRVASFRSDAARMQTDAWLAARCDVLVA